MFTELEFDERALDIKGNAAMAERAMQTIINRRELNLACEFFMSLTPVY
jgi:hypothetical protein